MTPAGAIPFVDTGSYPTRGGNIVVPWIDGEPAFRRICDVIDAARTSVWATVTFMWPSFRMPDGRGSALDILERAAVRGVDVRVIFWRPDDETMSLATNAFWGSPSHRTLLRDRYPHVNVRWDRAEPGFCQHQKTWLVDTDDDTATCFVGGINLNPHSVAPRDHCGAGQNHDVYVEIAGPAVADVHHNFVQRWNEASERHLDDGRWGDASTAPLRFPARAPRRRGDVLVQIQRTTHAGRYTDGYAPSDSSTFPIALGERTIFDQYLAAIGAARRTIYLENQYLEVVEIIDALGEALRRGVRVVAMVPAVPVIVRRAQPTETQAAAIAARARLATYGGFTLSGMAGCDAAGQRTPVYVHSKLMLVDGEWASVGSCNLHHYSLFGNGELNAAYQDADAVRTLRVSLFEEHLGIDTSDVDDARALTMFRRIACENRRRHESNDPRWQGMAISLDPTTYGVAPQL